jgi:hypothetical protein
MKPLLRAVLVVDALVTLAFGLAFAVTPWGAVYEALDLVAVSPAMVGQLFGVALLALGWLQLRAAFHGGLAVPVARAIGHAAWIAGVVVLVWLVAIRQPALEGLGKVVGPLIGVALLLLGLFTVRLAGVVRKRERALAAGAASAKRAEVRAAQAREREPIPFEPANPAAPDVSPAGRGAPPAEPRVPPAGVGPSSRD